MFEYRSQSSISSVEDLDVTPSPLPDKRKFGGEHLVGEVNVKVGVLEWDTSTNATICYRDSVLPWDLKTMNCSDNEEVEISNLS